MKRHFVKIIGLAMVLLLPAGAVLAKDVDWAVLNPAFKGATYVKDSSVCFGCHADYQKPYSETTHAKTFQFGKAPAAGDCESCHGPRSQHVENPGKELALTPAQQGAVCLQCHQGGDRMYWQSGSHKSAGTACTSCHTVMVAKSERNLLSRPSESDVCYSCHLNVRGQMQKTYHHPVREGKIDCSGCHEVHGTAGRGLLKGATVNETCYSCHQEKRGPFLWEHAPVRENCLTCHEAHGSNNPDLLTAKGPAQCVSCHQYGGHINQFRYNRTSNPYSKGCANCHVTVHGSNHPSGAKFNR